MAKRGKMLSKYYRDQEAAAADPMDLPEFLDRKKGDWKWDQKAAEAILSRITHTQEEEESIPLPEGLRLAQTAYGESGFALADGIIPRRWVEDQMAIVLANRSVNEKNMKRADSINKFKTAMAEKKAKEPKAAKPEFGNGIYMTVTPGAARKEGTKAATRFIEMTKYLEKNPSATVAEVLRDCAYKTDEYHWDLKKGNIKVHMEPPKKKEEEEKQPTKKQRNNKRGKGK